MGWNNVIGAIANGIANVISGRPWHRHHRRPGPAPQPVVPGPPDPGSPPPPPPVVPTTPTPTPTAGPAPAGDPGLATLHAYHNQARAAAGLPPLNRVDKLDASASAYAATMSSSDTMDHFIGDTTPQSRELAAGYSADWSGENIAKGQQAVAEVFADWMGSPGHRANILRQEFTDVGYGVVPAPGAGATPYWCVDFGTPAPAQARTALIAPGGTPGGIRAFRRPQTAEELECRLARHGIVTMARPGDEK